MPIETARQGDAGELHESHRLVQVGEATGLGRGGDVLAAGDVAELRFDGSRKSLGARLRPLDERDVVIERKLRAVGHHRAGPELERRLDQIGIGDVVELDAGPRRRALRGRADADQQLVASRGREGLATDQQHDPDVASGGRIENGPRDLEVVAGECAESTPSAGVLGK